MGARWSALAILGVLVLAGCGGDDDPAFGCTPGEVRECPCAGGATGTQTCLDDFTFGACQCGPDAGLPIDAGVLDDASPYDSGVVGYPLTVALDGTGGGAVTSTPGGITCEPACEAVFMPGAAVSLTAAPDGTSVFAGWTGDCTGLASCDVTMDAAKNVSASFTQTALTVTKTGDGEGTVTSGDGAINCGTECSAVYTRDAMVTLTATAAVNSAFDGWSGACSGSSTCMVTLNDAIAVEAAFSVDPCDPLAQDCPTSPLYGCVVSPSPEPPLCVLTGTGLPEGSACSMPGDCAPGLGCVTPPSGGAVCAPYCDYATYPDVIDPGYCGAFQLCMQPTETGGTAYGACLPDPETCLDMGTMRYWQKPTLGDLVISEYMANPENVSDSVGEWFEVVALSDVDLNGLQLGTMFGMPMMTITSPDCVHAAAGTRLLFAKGADPATNGGLPDVDVVFTGFSLPNSAGSIALEQDGALLDQVTWSSTVPMGRSVSLDPTKLSPADNDDPANWCNGRGVYGTGTDQGTPGAENDTCLASDTCLDGGTPRVVVSPAPGDLVVTEFMANPDVVSDTNGEWFEVLVVNAVDINGLQLGQTIDSPVTTLADADCLRHAAGSYVLFARNADPLANGGLPAVDYTFDFGLTNTTGSLVISLDGALLDAVAWTTSVTTARSESLDPDFTSPTANDIESNWCDGAGVYGTGPNEGTPAAANPQCP